MNPLVSVGIMHHPKRADRIPHLLNQLGHPHLVRLVTDHDSEGMWPTGRRAWQGHHPDATHHVVIQDDVLVCRDFVDTMRTVARLLPAEPISPYCPRKVIGEALLRGHSWVRIADGAWGQAILLPVPMIAPMIEWIDANVKPDYRSYDRRVSFYLAHAQRDVWTMAPSVVEHDAPTESIVGHTLANRVAYRFIGEDGRGTHRNWTRGLHDAHRSASPQRLPDEWRLTWPT